LGIEELYKIFIFGDLHVDDLLFEFGHEGFFVHGMGNFLKGNDLDGNGQMVLLAESHVHLSEGTLSDHLLLVVDVARRLDLCYLHFRGKIGCWSIK
jgi:hypothetical protein